VTAFSNPTQVLAEKGIENTVSWLYQQTWLTAACLKTGYHILENHRLLGIQSMQL
jgi:hypothetical protein